MALFSDITEWKLLFCTKPDNVISLNNNKMKLYGLYLQQLH